MSTKVRSAWDGIERWLQTNMPWSYDRLAPGIDDASLDAAEAILGFALPSDLQESYRIHNGMQEHGHWLRGPCGHWGIRRDCFLYDAHDFHSLETMIRQWYSDKDTNLTTDDTVPYKVRGAVRLDIRCKDLLSIARGPYFSYFVDMNPAEGGHVGQVIRFDYDQDLATYIAPSFGTWLGIMAELLEMEVYVYCSPLGRMESVRYAADELRYDRSTAERVAEYQRLEAIIAKIADRG